ncbi:MAG: DNA polymerase clamp loader subunit A [Candidatus Peribacteraceae bacterium]|nr:DNA polymerase clamp loader subunit A [Candidatus Peribacteraceae bacterium]
MATSPLFDCLNAINLKNSQYQYSKKDCSGYMLLMWFSHLPSCIGIVDKLNERLFTMTDEMVFAALYKQVPRSKKFLKWDKGKKDNKLTKKKEKIIQGLKDDHGFSEFEAHTIFKRYIDV